MLIKSRLWKQFVELVIPISVAGSVMIYLSITFHSNVAVLGLFALSVLFGIIYERYKEAVDSLDKVEKEIEQHKKEERTEKIMRRNGYTDKDALEELDTIITELQEARKNRQK